jgi:predicted DNA-binding transcriptional regulator AlpA
MVCHQLNDDTSVLVRLPTVLQIIPVSRSTWWAGVKIGRFPPPVRLGPRTVAWRKADILAIAENGVDMGGRFRSAPVLKGAMR